MGKLDEMMRGAGANVGESMGAGRQGPSVHRATPPPFAGMPARLQGVIKAKDTAEIPVDRIMPDPDQPREEFDEVALNHLAESLKIRGQLQPIRVRWDEGQGRYVILCGERRWRAAVRAEIKSMTCVIHEGQIASGEMLALQLVENLLREDLKPIEQAKAYRSLMDLNGWSARQVARELAIDHSGVTRALALLDLPVSVQTQVEQGALPPATAYEVSKLEDPDQQREVAALVVQDGLSRAEAVEHVRRVAKSPKKSKGATKANPPRPRTFRLTGGKAVLEPKKVGGTEALLAMVRELAEVLETELGTRDQEAA